ncbi:hypothetical protein, partial [Deferrisoma palaeochoriense]
PQRTTAPPPGPEPALRGRSIHAVETFAFTRTPSSQVAAASYPAPARRGNADRAGMGEDTPHTGQILSGVSFPQQG